MKNLFKNLMLVAVAAMAFVACSEVSVEVDNLVKKTIINGTASINTDDTRSGFVGSETVENEDGTTTTVYKSAWDGGENIKIFNGSQEITTTIDAEGKFTVELEGTPGFITVCSPAEAWVSTYTCNIPTVQTPRTNSVDPAAHILQHQNAQVSNDTVNAKMQHQVGYGKMTVNTPAEFVIDYVEVELNGVWYGSTKTLNYTINADNVEGNVFWFATDVVEVSDFTVTAYDAEGNAYTKSVTIPEGRELKFQYGRVSTFSVSNLEKYEYVASISASYDGWNGYFGFTIDTVDGARLFPRLYVDAVSNMIPEGTHANPSWVSNHGVLYEDSVNLDGYYDFTSCTYAVEWLENGGYKIDFQLTAKNGKVYEFTYAGVINGICNPPAPDAVTVETVATSVSGNGNMYFTLNLTTESYLFNELWFNTSIDGSIIAEGTFNVSDATVTYLDENGNDSGWEFGVSGTITVAHDLENQQYNLTFNLEDENGSTFVVTYSGKITGSVYNPGEATPLNSPSNINYEVVNFTDVVITWDAVEGAGSYELYYEYSDNSTNATIQSEPVTATDTTYTFSGLTPGIYYTIFVKALPSTSANTESEYASLYNVIVYSAPDTMETSYTFTTAQNMGNNKIRFIDANNNTADIQFDSTLTEISAGIYYEGYGTNYVSCWNCTFNGSTMYPLNYVLVEGNPGETQTVTIVAAITYGGEVVKSVFTGVINMEAPTLEYTSATIAYDGNNLAYNFTGDGIGLYFNYYANGADGIAEGTYTFTAGTHYSSYYTYTYDYQYMSSIDLTVTGAIGETQTYEFVLHTEYAGDIKAKYTGVLKAQ